MSASLNDRANALSRGVLSHALGEVPPGRQGRRAATAVRRPDGCTGLTFAYWDELWNYYDKWTRPAAERVVADAEHEYYCPMHPSVVQSEPGNCPICGMPLSKRKKGHVEALSEGGRLACPTGPDAGRPGGNSDGRDRLRTARRDDLDSRHSWRSTSGI